MAGKAWQVVAGTTHTWKSPRQSSSELATFESSTRDYKLGPAGTPSIERISYHRTPVACPEGFHGRQPSRYCNTADAEGRRVPPAILKASLASRFGHMKDRRRCAQITLGEIMRHEPSLRMAWRRTGASIRLRCSCRCQVPGDKYSNRFAIYSSRTLREARVGEAHDVYSRNIVDLPRPSFTGSSIDPRTRQDAIRISGVRELGSRLKARQARRLSSERSQLVTLQPSR